MSHESSLSERLAFDPGQILFREGDAADSAFLVIAGTVAMSIHTRHGPRVLNTLGPGDVVGESAIFSDAPHTATATAATRVEVLRVSRALFSRTVRDDNYAALLLHRLLAQQPADGGTRFAATG